MAMSRVKLGRQIAALVLLGCCSNGWAVTVPNPDPTLLDPDINGTGLFSHSGGLLNIEIFDLAEALSSGSTGFEFGFYYAGGNPSSGLNTIFGAEDNNNFLATPQVAAVDFTNGMVLDLDDGVQQSSFAPDPGAVADIGFYLRFGTDAPIFTQALLIPGAEDLAAEFPFKENPLAFLISFAVPIGEDIVPLSYQFVFPLTPSPIPLPGAAGLWLLGLAGIALFRRRISNSTA